MPIGIRDEHEELRQSLRRWIDARCPPSVARTALEADVDHLPSCWDDLAAQGFLGMQLPEEFGGQGAGLIELAVVAEALGGAAAPGPWASTAVVGAVVSEWGSPSQAKAILPGLADGSDSGLAGGTHRHPRWSGRTPPGTVGEPRPRRHPHRRGIDRPRPQRGGGRPGPGSGVGGGGGHLGAARTGRHRLGGGAPELRPHPAVGVLDAGRRRPAPRPGAGRGADRAHPAAGPGGGVGRGRRGARWCLDTAADHARTRAQFGRPIGQFQGVKHRLADMLVSVEQVVAATWDAARWPTPDRPGPTEAAARRPAVQPAAALALDGYVEAAKGCHPGARRHGLHLGARRPHPSAPGPSLRQLLGGTAPFAARRPAWPSRAGAAGWPSNCPPRPSQLRGELRPGGRGHRRHRAIRPSSAGRWSSRPAGPPLAVPVGPRRRSRRAAGHRPGLRRGRAEAAQSGRGGLGPAHHHRPRHPRADRALGGSDPARATCAGASSSASPGPDRPGRPVHPGHPGDGGGPSTARRCGPRWRPGPTWGICLARTDPDVPKHRGITYFLVDMRSPGIEVRPLREITGTALFNEVFFDRRASCPTTAWWGRVDGGWRLARTTLANERVSLSSDSAFGGALEEVLLRIAAAPRAAGPGDLRPPGRLLAEAQSLAQLGVRATLRSVGGLQPGPESSVRKLLGAEFEQRVHEFGLDLCGPDGRPHRGRRRPVSPRRAAEQVPDHRRRDQRGPAQRHRRAPARATPGSGAGPVTCDTIRPRIDRDRRSRGGLTDG